MCLISKTAGEAHINGYDVSNEKDSLKIRKLIGLVPDNVGLYGELSAYKNLIFMENFMNVRITEKRKY